MKQKKTWISFFILLGLGVFWKAVKYEAFEIFTYFLYFIPFIIIWSIVIIGLFVIFVIEMKNRKWKQLCIMSLCVLLLMLPLDRVYESIRFHVLRNEMEALANETALFYQEKLESTQSISVPLKREKMHLSRGGSIGCIVEDQIVKVIFYIYADFDHCDVLVYSTDVPIQRIYLPDVIQFQLSEPELPIEKNWV